MCLGGSPPPAPPPPPPPPQPQSFSMPEPPAPVQPPPPPVSAGQKMATISSKTAATKAAPRSKGASAFRAPSPRMSTIKGQATGLNLPAAG